jgi:hypothetical protein
MPRFRVTNRVTHGEVVVEALTAAEACARFGWPISDCHVQPQAEDSAPDVTEEWAQDLIDRLRKLPEPQRTLTWDALRRVIAVAEGCAPRDHDQGNRGAGE